MLKIIQLSCPGTKYGNFKWVTIDLKEGLCIQVCRAGIDPDGIKIRRILPFSLEGSLDVFFWRST